MYNVFLTGLCNLHCSYCFAETWMVKKRKSTTTSTRMNLETFNEVLTFLSRSGISSVSLMGGEPTLHPEFFLFIRMAQERNFSVSIKSNAAWSKNVLLEILALPNEGIHFLLNINSPSSVSKYFWEIIRSNIASLEDKLVDFQLNIDRINFDYEYLLELATQCKPGQIVWSLSSLVRMSGSDLISNPLMVRRIYSKRIMEFVSLAGEQKIPTLGVHGVTPCMFTKADYDSLLASGGRLRSTCIPVFDFMPDGSVLFCFPMGNFFNRTTIFSHNNLQEIQQEFMSSLVFLRSDTYPLPECFDCSHSDSNTCHGGCIAHHLNHMPEKDHSEERFDSRIPQLAGDLKFEISKMNGTSELGKIIDQHNCEYELGMDLLSIITCVDGKKTMNQLYRESFRRFPDNPAVRQIFNSIMLQLLRKGVLILKPYRDSEEVKKR